MGFQPREGDCQLPLQITCVRQLQARSALDSGLRALRKHRSDPSSAALVQSQPLHTRFGPGQQPERRERHSGIEVEILAVKLNQHYVGVQPPPIHPHGTEKVILPVRGPYAVGFEARRPNQSEKKPGKLIADYHSRISTHLRRSSLSFRSRAPLLLRPLHFVRCVAHLLYARVNLSEFHFRRIVRRNDFLYFMLHGLTLPHKAFQLAVQLFPCLDPELVYILLWGVLDCRQSPPAISARFRAA